MRYHIATTALTLLSAIGYHALAQRQADTLHRQLQVLTHQDEVIEERMPLELHRRMPQPPRAKQIQLSAGSLRSYPPSIKPQALSALSPLQAFYDQSPQKGYLSLGLGLKYNAYLSGAWRAIDSPTNSLDLGVDARYTHAEVNDLDWLRPIREERMALGGNYQSLSASGLRFGLRAGLSHERYNYYGAIRLGNPPKTSQLSLPWLSTQQAQTSLLLSRLDDEALPLAYEFKPYAIYTSSKGLSLLSPDYRVGELQLGVSALLRYKLASESYIKLALEGTGYIYNADKLGSTDYPYGNMGLIQVKPYWSYRSDADTEWGLDLGAGLHLYTQQGRQGIYISPYLSSYIKLSPSWQLSLRAEGGLKANNHSALLRDMPYLRLGLDALPTYSPIDATLRLEGLIQPNLQVEAFASYARYRDAINYEARTTVESNPLPDRYATIAFAPTSADGGVFKLGGGLTYRFSPSWTLSSKASYSSWTQALYGRPQLELMAELSYRPMQSLELIVAYDLKQGIEQMLTTDSTSSRHSLPALSSLRLSASYRLAPRWTLSLGGHALIGGDSPLYYGYTTQRFSATLGISYKF